MDFSWNNSSLAEQKKTAGNDLYNAKNYSAALDLYSEAISLCPNNAIYYGNRSACLFMMGEYKSALLDSQYAVLIDNKFSKGYERIIKCCFAMGDIDGVKNVIEKLVRIGIMKDACKIYINQYKQVCLHYEKIQQYEEKRSFKRAMFHVDRVLKIATKCVKTNLLKAEFLIYLGQMKEANDIICRYMISNPSSPYTRFTRGLYLYHKTDADLEECMEHFKRALLMDPKFLKAAKLFVQVGKLKEMRETGNNFFKNGQFLKAHHKYTEALQITPLNEDIKSKVLFNRALMNSKIGRLHDAIDDCTSSLKINRNYLKAILLRAKCHSDLHNYKECIKDYKAAMKINYSDEIKIALDKAKIAFNKAKMTQKPEKKNYYQILGVERNATAEVIRQAYKKLALIHHPDRHSSATEDVKREHERIFKEISQAYDTLNDSFKKAQYDYQFH